MKSQGLVKFRRDAIVVYLLGMYIKHFLKRCYASCFVEAAKMEHLESHISGIVSSAAFRILRKKYKPEDCSPSDPYRSAVKARFHSDSGKLFLRANILCVKSYISPKEKGVLIVKYTEILNALPFLFDLKKIQERYHLIIEPSAESPYQMYSAFLPTGSCVFAQSLSVRERDIHKAHGFYPLPITAGDWVNIKNFHPDPTIEKKYDFCVIANFLPVKRYPYLFAALNKYWTGDLKFAIVASSYVGEDKKWMNELLAQSGLSEKLDLYIQVPATEVNKILNQSYCHVLGSLREGANKANFESMTAGTPVVVHKDHIGFPNWKFSPPMVINYTNAENLVSAIKQCKNADRMVVAGEAKKLIGSRRATEIINEEMKRVTTGMGDEWTVDLLEKVNNVHTFYADPGNVVRCADDYLFLESVVLDRSHYSAELAMKRFTDNIN